MTLHEAIVEILQDNKRVMTTQEITDEVNRRRNYQKRDGSPVATFQIHGRTRGYAQLFTRDGSKVGLRQWGDEKVPRPTGDTTPQPATDVDPAIEVGTANDVGSVAFLKSSGFICLGPIGPLVEEGLPDDEGLNSCGVYAVSIPAGYVPKYVSPDDASETGNVVSPWPTERLQQKWVSGVDVIYYGLAGRDKPRTLAARLNDLLRHGAGDTTSNGPHKGGEIMWQLSGTEKMSLWYLATGEPPVPRLTEKALIEAFEAKYEALPFANRQR